MDTININGSEYQRHEILGCGGSSRVYKLSNKSGETMALKIVDLKQPDPEMIAGFKNEINLLRTLQKEPRVIRLIDNYIDTSSIYIIMEYGDVDLRHMIALQMARPLDVLFVRHYSLELFKCVQAVHGYGIVHSDLKPENFLSVSGRLKIIDFGLANNIPEFTKNVYRNMAVGTINYMAPETLIEHTKPIAGPFSVSAASDVWSLGCIIYEMVYGTPPFKACGRRQIEAICDPETKIFYLNEKAVGGSVPISAIELMEACTRRDPKMRVTVKEAIDSIFLNNYVLEYSDVVDTLSKAVSFGFQNKNANFDEESTEFALKLSRKLAL